MSNKYPNSVKCKKPRFKSHRGRTWDNCKVIDIDGVENKGWLDTSWGEYFYFVDNNGFWRKAKLQLFDNIDLCFDFRLLNKAVAK